MTISVHFSAAKQTKWHEYAVRFLFGGIITVLAGLIAEKYGPSVGGLFLAFPAILPASATLIEKHEIQRKHRRGFHGTVRGREVASIDAAGAAIGSFGLVAFGLVVWQFLPGNKPVPILVTATLAWLATAVLAWKARKMQSGLHRKLKHFFRPKPPAPH